MITRFWRIVLLFVFLLLIPTQTAAQDLSCDQFLEVLPNTVLAFNFPDSYNTWFTVYHGRQEFSGWGSPENDYIAFPLQAFGIVLEPGDYIRVDDGNCYKDHIYEFLQPDIFYPGQTVIYGWAGRYKTVIIRHDWGGNAKPDVAVEADNRGRWSIDLTAAFDYIPEDIGPGFTYEALIKDIDGDATLIITSSWAPQCNRQDATIYVEVREDGEHYIVGGRLDGSVYRGTLRGTEGDDVIAGTTYSDVIFADIGNDLVCGFEGNDLIVLEGGGEAYGGQGDDALYGFGANSILFGEAGNDRLIGSNGSDELYGGPGFDRFYGREGNDFIFSIDDGKRDWILAGPGYDVCHIDPDIDSNHQCEELHFPEP